MVESMEIQAFHQTQPSVPVCFINLYYSGTAGNARRFAEEMEKSGTADRIRSESGNLRYEYFIPLDDPETILLIDSWKD